MISVEALELLLKVDSAVERHNGGCKGEASYLDAKERLHDFIATLEYHVSSLEAQLAATQARLAAYEEGYDPKVELPKNGQTVIAKEVRNDQPMYWDLEFHKAQNGNLWVNWAFAEPSKEAQVIRWFPLPGAKEAK